MYKIKFFTSFLIWSALISLIGQDQLHGSVSIYINKKEVSLRDNSLFSLNRSLKDLVPGDIVTAKDITFVGEKTVIIKSKKNIKFNFVNVKLHGNSDKVLVLRVENCEDLSFSGLEIKQLKNVKNGHASTVKVFFSKNISFSGGSIEGSEWGFNVHGTEGLVIKNYIFKNNHFGFTIKYSTNARVIDCLFRDNDYNIYHTFKFVEDLIFQGCTFENHNPQGRRRQFKPSGYFKDCNFLSKTWILVSRSGKLSSGGSPEKNSLNLSGSPVVYVNKKKITLPNRHLKYLEDVIKGMKSGDELIVSKNTFIGYLPLIIGYKENIKLMFNEVSILVTNRSSTVMTIVKCKNMVISGLTAAHLMNENICSGSVIDLVSSSDITFNGGKFNGCGTTGLSISVSSDITINNVKLFNNTTSGVKLFRSKNIKVNNCDFYNNKMNLVITGDTSVLFDSCNFKNELDKNNREYNIDFFRNCKFETSFMIMQKPELIKASTR